MHLLQTFLLICYYNYIRWVSLRDRGYIKFIILNIYTCTYSLCDIVCENPFHLFCTKHKHFFVLKCGLWSGFLLSENVRVVWLLWVLVAMEPSWNDSLLLLLILLLLLCCVGFCVAVQVTSVIRKFNHIAREVYVCICY
jgi:ABC-type polysaccharide/polyol phosphate export permease